jgi:hypothetical protein
VQLSAVQVAASTLASVSAAVVASLFGVTGTVVGAGLVAVLSTTGSALYSVSMKRTSNQLRRAREQLLTARPPARSGSTAVLDQTPTRSRSQSRERDERTIDLTDGADTKSQAQDAEATEQQPRSRWRRGWLTVGSRRGLKWPALLGAAALVFAIAIGAITAFEALTQKPISSLTGHSSSSSTTIGSLSGGSKATNTPTPTPTETGGGSGAATATPRATPSVERSATSPSRSAAPATPSAGPSTTVAPTSAAPRQSVAPKTGQVQAPAP